MAKWEPIKLTVDRGIAVLDIRMIDLPPDEELVGQTIVHDGRFFNIVGYGMDGLCRVVRLHLESTSPLTESQSSSIPGPTMKLHQVLAIEKDVKSRAHKLLSEIYKNFQKGQAFEGLSRTYRKRFEDGEDFPSERKKVIFSVSDQISQVRAQLTEVFDWVATKDWANTHAKADLVVDDKVILKDVPATYFLYLEDELKNLKDEVTKIPELDQSVDWEYDEQSGSWKTRPVESVRTAKVQEPLVLHAPTKEHPAQTQLITKDVTIGYWAQVRESTAMPVTEKKKLLERILKLSDAVKIAREAANQVESPAQHPSNAILTYLFA